VGIANGVFDLKPFPAEVFQQAFLIANRHTSNLGTRTLDVLHVAAAFLLQADTFYTFDRHQEKLAIAEGFTVG
jgi:predicted nucleic acid-binding protein